MPITPRGYQAVPYAGPPRYVPNYGTLGELMGLRAQNAAQGWAQIAALFDRFVQQRNAAEVAKAVKAEQTAQREAEMQLKRDELAERTAAREEAERVRRETEKRQQRLDADKLGTDIADSIGYGPMSESQVDPVMQSSQAGRVRYAFGPGTAEGPELMPTRDQQRAITAEQEIRKLGGILGPNGQVVMPPRPTASKSLQRETALVNGRPMFVNFNPETGAYTDVQGNPVTPQPMGPQRDPEKPSVWVSKGSDMRFVTPTEAAQLSAEGWRSGQSREQGRPVTSGDAGEIADYDTALDDIGVVRGALSGNQATGTRAAIGAAMPNYITDTFGWGTEAKQKQAVIDRVKQVIGKALEGGVLRKEDEIKYAKILPVISDTPDVVTSKLQGLESAIAQRKQRKLDALSDAGYDVGRFAARGQSTVTAVPDLAGIREGFSRTFRSGPFAGQEWAMVNGQPKRIK